MAEGHCEGQSLLVKSYKPVVKLCLAKAKVQLQKQVVTEFWSKAASQGEFFEVENIMWHRATWSIAGGCSSPAVVPLFRIEWCKGRDGYHLSTPHSSSPPPPQPSLLDPSLGARVRIPPRLTSLSQRIVCPICTTVLYACKRCVIILSVCLSVTVMICVKRLNVSAIILTW